MDTLESMSLSCSEALKKWVEDHDGELPHSIAIHPVTRKLQIPQVGDSLEDVRINYGPFKITFIANSAIPEGAGIMMPKPLPLFEFDPIEMLSESEDDGKVKMSFSAKGWIK
ncbi:hypothetical protein LZD49_28535 [Dyadobacter sp. CY261]|uniref:hypothetical protein n=1 Tax=Dyadobacter sp. CY261 TaxID=2907203 RepID=UPI001F1C4F29|nr:hypothetical protein [Dyadobacter sp. CY261]MCF0074466.1 hypothetical protein [Dyadobacter sp. CY261]